MEDWVNYRQLINGEDGNNGGYLYTKYCASKDKVLWGGSGDPDNKTALDQGDDVAHVLLGGKWRMPTYEEWLALTNQTSFSDNDTSSDKVKGRMVNSKTNPENKVFLPFVCQQQNTWLYWSSSLSTDYISSHANAIGMKSNWWITGAHVYRWHGLVIRPVMEENAQ